MIRMNGFFRALFAALLGAALLTAQAQDKGAKGAATKPARAMPVRAVPAHVAPAVDNATAVGSLRADEAIVIRPEIAGRIERIAFGEGQAVGKGDLLVVLNAAELRAVLASSTAQAKLEKQRLERAEDLFRKKFISEQGLDETRSNHARSIAKLREDEARLAKATLRAPFAGVAGLRQVSEGAYLAAGTDIARLEKIDLVKLDFRMPEVFLGKLKTGQAVRVGVDAFPGAAFSGAIFAIEPAVDEQTRTVLVRARVENTGLKLRPGMFARVVLQLGTRPEAVWVPEQSIVPRGRDNFVFRIVAGKADRVKVQLGMRKVGEVEVVKGIAAGDLVVTEGAERIRPGSAVAVMGAKPKPTAPEAMKGAGKAGTAGKGG
ncbi:MAG: efflux RND transporter periplasmic adaptor subunit [Proteobacteria bacterium]|nr:efflux RND transporter periplasmic adaptor subunit [Pseudomonadota bacterium]